MVKNPVFGQYGAREGEREVDDYYRSPPDAIHCLTDLTMLTIQEPVLDAGAGDGVLLDGLKECGYDVRGVELSMCRPEHPDIARGVDFLTFRPKIQYDSVVMNPPFKQSDEFVRHALDLVPDGGRVYALLRHTWPSAQKRSDLLPMIREIIICGRLKMLPASKQHLDKGYSGTVDFSWFVFEKAWNGGMRMFRA